MTGPSAGRSRAKNSLPQINVAAKEYVNSNSTSAMFLGGQQKSWMTGLREVEINSSRGPSKTNNGRKSGMLREGSVNQPSVNTATGNLNSTTSLPCHSPENQQSPPADNCLNQIGRNGAPLQKASGGAVHNVETVLPSPAPSDEHRSDNIRANDSEIDGGIFTVHGSSDQTSSNIQLRGSESTNNPEENEQFDRMLRDALSATTPPASDTTISQAQQLPIQLPGATVARQISHQGSSEKKRKRIETASGTSDLGMRPSHTLPSTESPSNSGVSGPRWRAPTDAQMSKFQQILIDRQQQRATISAPGDTEVARLNLLQRAFIQHDHMYLLLHQIYCMDLTLPVFSKQLGEVGFQNEHINGLAMLVPLLLPNLQCMAPDSVHWLAHFPTSFSLMLGEYQIYREALESVKTCLASLSHGWLNYRECCNKRAYPPLVGELVDVLGIESPVLQSVVFRAILKDMWMGNTNDSCFQEGEGLFQQNQQLMQQGRSQTDRKRDDQHLIIKYQLLNATHANHRRNSGSNASPSTLVNPPLMTEPPSGGNTPFQQSPRLAHGPLAGSQNHYRVRPPVDRRRAPPPPNISTQFAHHLPTIANRTTPTLPSQPLLRSQHSPSAPQGNARGYLISPPIPASSAGLQAPQVRRSSNNGPTTVTSPYPNGSPQFASRNVSPASRSNPWPAPMSNLPRSHLVPHSQANRPAPSPRLIDRAMQMPPAGSLPQAIRPQPLFLPVGQRLSSAAHPNPIVAALHQYQARSPLLTVVDDFGRPTMNTKYFRYIEGVAILDNRLKVGKRQHAEFPFYIGEDDAALLSGTREGQKGGPSIRNVRVGSRFGRIRCIDATKIADVQHDNQRTWVTANQTWPEHVTVIFNGRHLDIRKKIHYGKDLPIDVTAAIKFGNNKFSVSIISPQTEDQTEYAVGLETIQLVDAAGAKDLTGVLPYEEARQRILRRLQNEDPDIEVVNSYVVINMSDPYTSRIWNVPMRGRFCRHDQCFDLDTFLETRTSKRSGQPCDPDQFKCPVCGGDARPQSLIKDEFFEVLRAELAQRDRLDAKAIIIQQDGTWEVQEEEKTGETGDGSGRRSGPRAESTASATTKETGQIEVIEID